MKVFCNDPLFMRFREGGAYFCVYLFLLVSHGLKAGQRLCSLGEWGSLVNRDQ